MQFLVIAKDRTDDGALDRRMAARPAHLEMGDVYKKEGKHLYAAALLNDENKMIGSALVVDFPSRKELDEWLAKEPYVLGDVWQHIEITPCKVGPSFLK